MSLKLIKKILILQAVILFNFNFAEAAGEHPHEYKDGSHQDLFKRPNGEICVKPKDNSGPDEDINININDILKKQ